MPRDSIGINLPSMKSSIMLFCGIGILAGCALAPLDRWNPNTPGTADIVVARPDSETPRPQARPDRGADTEGSSDLTANSSAGQSGAGLGETLANLGSPTEPGLWLRTGLVTRVQQGRVARADGNGTIRVELRPSGAAPSAGSQLSLAAFRALDAPLTQLVKLRVFAE